MTKEFFIEKNITWKRQYQNVGLLSEQDMKELVSTRNNGQGCFMSIFGPCPSITLDIIERWLQDSSSQIRSSLIGKAISMNPNVTVDFIKAHPEIRWDYSHLSMNPMGQHEWFEYQKQCAPLYVLK